MTKLGLKSRLTADFSVERGGIVVGTFQRRVQLLAHPNHISPFEVQPESNAATFSAMTSTSFSVTALEDIAELHTKVSFRICIARVGPCWHALVLQHW